MSKYKVNPAALQATLNHFVDAGWIRSSYIDGTYLHVDWTRAGRQKAEQLFELMRELGLFHAEPHILILMEFVLGFTLKKL